MAEPNDVGRALREGARRSMLACSDYRSPPLPVRLWRRLRWPLIGAGLFLFVEFLGALVGSNLRHF